uniref:Pentatricopeptide repeat-containing protein n=1 Tax=Kalanchoe fedtschenkoi TaxID=63787 RepID=A0A7N0U6G9_KALFE
MRASKSVLAALRKTMSYNPMALCRFLGSSTALSSSSSPDCTVWNKKISHLIRTGQIEEAKKVFNAIEHKNTVTWNAMITGHVKRREMAKARKLFDEMPERDVVSWNLMISGYLSCRGVRFVEEGRLLFDQMPVRDTISWNTMITGYLRDGRVSDALRLFESMIERDVVTWNAMISGFLQNGVIAKAIEIFESMPERDSTSLCAVVSGLIHNGRIDKAAKLLVEFGAKDGYSENLVNAYNALIAGYSQRGQVDEARRVFDQIPYFCDQGKRRGMGFEKNVVSWNKMIKCYVKAGDLISARGLFDQMIDRDIVSWNTIISGYVQVPNMEGAIDLFNRMLYRDAITWNSMIMGFAEVGNLELAYEFFQRMPQRNLISWNSIISGYEKNSEYDWAINLYLEMQADGMKPDQHTLSSILSGCAGSVNLLLGAQIHQQVTKLVIGDVPINNSLITMYSRCGAILEARTMFDEMKTKDVISWNAMIAGYASHGYATEALQLFEFMKQQHVKPTQVTFTSVLSACANAGFTEAGKYYFNSMASQFRISPRMEHFSSLVDMIGRSGQLQEALHLIKSMPFQPDKTVWGALLGASRVHNNVTYGRIAAEALMTLDPESSAPYALLYNIYADLGQLNEAAEVKMLMRRNNVGKHVAASWVGSPHSETRTF